MPMIIFGDGLTNKSHVKYKGLRTGVIDKLYRQLKLREKMGELLLLDISEFNTSKVKYSYAHFAQIMITEHLIFRYATDALRKTWRI